MRFMIVTALILSYSAHAQERVRENVKVQLPASGSTAKFNTESLVKAENKAAPVKEVKAKTGR